MLEKIKQWWQKVPLPHNPNSEKEWICFADNAPRWQIESIYQSELKSPIYQPFVQAILLKQLWRTQWPKISKKFICAHQPKTILKLPFSSIKLAAAEHPEDGIPRYMIDVNNQVLGIVLSKNCVITKIYNQYAYQFVATELQDELLTKEDICNLVFPARYQLAKMLQDIGIAAFHKDYWIRDNNTLKRWLSGLEVFTSGQYANDKAFMLGKEIF